MINNEQVFEPKNILAYKGVSESLSWKVNGSDHLYSKVND